MEEERWGKWRVWKSVLMELESDGEKVGWTGADLGELEKLGNVSNVEGSAAAGPLFSA